MAGDLYDIDWGEDPFAGDIDFDMDFSMDPHKGKSFIGGLATGFLSGVATNTIGEGKRVKTLRTILPSSFSNALDKVNFVDERIDELAREFREENYETAKSLQSIASSLSQRMGSKLPGFMNDGLTRFSEKDFSSWEKLDPNAPVRLGGVDEASDDEVGQAIDAAVMAQSGMFSALGESLNQMTAQVGAKLQSSINTSNRQLVNIESSVRDLMNYHRNVQAKVNQAQLSLQARAYVQDAKFYKFMEAGIHTQVDELKKIALSSALSDLEKTSTYTASKGYLRDRIFNTVGKRMGGLTGMFREKFSEDNRKYSYGLLGSIAGVAADSLAASEGAPMSRGMMGDMLGKMIAGVAIEQLPVFFQRGPGKRAIDKMIKAYPEQGAWIKEQVKQITDIGNVVSYAATSGVGVANHMAENYQPMDEMKFLDYDDYRLSLKPGQKAIPKALWVTMNTAGNASKTAINKLMSDITRTRGTQYTLTRRNVKDLTQAAPWTQMNNVTINEVIPGLISRTNQILEQIRTGSSDVERESFNYMRGQFQTESDKRVAVQADLMPHSEFLRYASASLELVDSLDPQKLLSAGARKALAKQIAKDIDAEKGFNPYYYLGEIPGMSKSHQDEVKAVLKRHFGIADSDVSEYNNADSFNRMKKMMSMPTSEGRERLNTASASAANIKENFPNVAERIDLLRATGNEQMLRDIGVIYTENGIDKVNIQMFHDRVGQYMDNPNDPILRGMSPGSLNSKPTVGGISSRPSTGKATNPFGDLNSTLMALNENVERMSLGKSSDVSETPTAAFDSVTGELTSIKENTAGMFGKMTEMATMFGEFNALAKSGKLFAGATQTASEDREVERAKDGIINRFRKVVPSNMLDKGVDLLMRNSPLIMGGLLGTLGGSMVQNPLLAASIGGAGLMAGAYLQWRNRGNMTTATGGEPNDDEDILDSRGEPILSARKLNAGDYIDAVSKRVIKTWGEVKGPIYDTAERVTIGTKELAGKVFGPDGREVALRGLRAVRDAAANAYDMADPIGRIKSIIASGKEMMYQQDIYVKGERSPRLLGIKFKSGEYFVRNQNGEMKPLSGWNEIDGPVYNTEGETLVAEDEVDQLITSTGNAVRNLGAIGSGVVGGLAGLGRSALDFGLGKFGFSRIKGAAGAAASAASGKFGSPNGVEKRLDKIYRLLATKFEMPMEGDEDGGTDYSPTGGLRLNSLAFKAKAAKEEEQHEVNEAIIKIAKNTEGMGETDEKGEQKGLWGTLKGLLGGLGGFAAKLFKNPLGAIGGVLTAGLKSVGGLAKIGTAMFSGVLGLASPLYKLLKAGFSRLAMAFAGRKLAGDMMGGGDVDQIGQSGRRRKGGAKKPGRFGRLRGRMGGLGALAVGSGLAYGASKLLEPGEEDWDGSGEAGTYSSDPNDITSRETKMGERDPRTGHYRTGGDVIESFLTDYLPQGMLAKAAMDGAMPKEAKAVTDRYGFFWASDGKIFFNRDNMEMYEDQIRGVSKDAAGGYSPPKLPTGKPTTQKKVRFGMYGIVEMDSGLARRVELLESLLYPYVNIVNDRATFKADTPIEKILQQFANAGNSKFSDKDAIATWFMARFKPVFMIYNAAISIARLGDINEFDNSKQYDVIQVIERVQQSIATLDPYPYNIDVRIDTDMALMNDQMTRRWIDVLMAKLREIIKSPVVSVEKIATDAQSREQIENGIGIKSVNPDPGAGIQDKMGQMAAQAAQAEVDRKFKQPEQVKEIDISDLMPGKDQEMDPFVMARLAAYGNVDNMSWRIEAVLRLERYMENMIMVIGDDARFTGSTGRILEIFKPVFRINSDLAANNWLTWFRDRFLPVMMTYTKEIKKYRGSTPQAGWKQLSDTNRVEIARRLCEQVVSVDDQQKAVWEIEASPFPNSKSGPWADKADKYLKILDAKSQEARLKDPELEASKSTTVSERVDPQQNAQAANIRARTEKALADAYGTPAQATTGNFGVGGGGTGTTFSGTGSTYNAPSMGGAGSAGEFQGSANGTFNPEFLKVAGDDKGIKMSPEQGEQLMLHHLVKAGIKDNKTLALALAMAKKETGNYSATVENTNWSAPTLLKYFKNIPDQATAQKVAAMSPPERAMWVYGRAPKGPSLGNTKPEDGWLYRGRGLFQLTGKSNYERFKKETGIDVVSNPRLVSEDPNVMAETAVRFLQNSPAMKSIAKTGDFESAVRGINGGNAVPATDERRRYYNEYLNRLRSGDMSLDGTEDGAPNEAPTTPPPTSEAPNAADKNVPADAVTNPENIPQPTKAGSVASLLDEGDTASKASNLGSAPTIQSDDSNNFAGNEIPTSTPPADSGATGADSTPTGPTSTGTTAPVAAAEPVKRKTMADSSVVKPQPPQPIKAEVQMPDKMATSDEQLAGLMAKSIDIQSQILTALKNSGKGNSLVHM